MLPLRYCCLSGGSCVECQFTQQGGLCRISLEKETANRGVCSARTTATRSSSVEPPQLRRDAGSRCTTTVCGRKGTACDGRSARGGARFQEGTAHGPARAHQLC